MKNTTLDTIHTDDLAQVSGGAAAGWLGMISNALGGSSEGKGLGEMMGGGGGGLNGKGGGLAETVGGWARGLLGGGTTGGTVEGQ
jgi:hypothetical protein